MPVNTALCPLSSQESILVTLINQFCAAIVLFIILGHSITLEAYVILNLSLLRNCFDALFTDHCWRSRKRIGDLHEQRLQLRHGAVGDGDRRGGLLDVLAGAGGGGDRGVRAEAGDTEGLPAVPEVADEPVLGQLPSQTPSVLGDHIHPAKAEHEIVFFPFSFLFLPL